MLIQKTEIVLLGHDLYFLKLFDHVVLVGGTNQPTGRIPWGHSFDQSNETSVQLIQLDKKSDQEIKKVVFQKQKTISKLKADENHVYWIENGDQIVRRPLNNLDNQFEKVVFDRANHKETAQLKIEEFYLFDDFILWFGVEGSNQPNLMGTLFRAPKKDITQFQTVAKMGGKAGHWPLATVGGYLLWNDVEKKTINRSKVTGEIMFTWDHEAPLKTFLPIRSGFVGIDNKALHIFDSKSNSSIIICDEMGCENPMMMGKKLFWSVAKNEENQDSKIMSYDFESKLSSTVFGSSCDILFLAYDESNLYWIETLVDPEKRALKRTSLSSI